jgi:hypothetical protein
VGLKFGKSQSSLFFHRRLKLSLQDVFRAVKITFGGSFNALLEDIWDAKFLLHGEP